MSFDYETWKKEYDAKLRKEAKAKASRLCRARKSPDGVVLTMSHEDGETTEGFPNAAKALEWAEGHYGGRWHGGYWVTDVGQAIHIDKGGAHVSALMADRKEA